MMGGAGLLGVEVSGTRAAGMVWRSLRVGYEV